MTTTETATVTIGGTATGTTSGGGK
jgi:hypothetical protein